MEPVSEGKLFLSDIEQSIEKALALIKTKDLGCGDEHLHSKKNSTTSFYNVKVQESNLQNFNTLNSIVGEASRSTSPLKPSWSHDKIQINDIPMSDDSTGLPFSENPIQNTIEEMQRLLNEKCPDLTQFYSSPPLSPANERSRVSSDNERSPRFSIIHALSPVHEPSPEEILNLYSQDLGIFQSNNLSPRGSNIYDFSDSIFKNSTKLSKGDKKLSKKHKPQNIKVNSDIKLDVKKNNKTLKSEVKSGNENKLKELMNIYGGSGKYKKSNVNMIVNSKSRISKNVDKKPQINTSMLTMSSSKAATKKSKKKPVIRDDVDLSAHSIPIEQISRQSVKRKVKQKNNDKVTKKLNLKRKIGTNLSTENVSIKINKSQVKNLACQNQSKPSHLNKKYQMRNKDRIDEVLPKGQKNITLRTVPNDANDACIYADKENVQLNNHPIQNKLKIIQKKQLKNANAEQIGFDSEKYLNDKITDCSTLNKNLPSEHEMQHNYINEDTYTQHLHTNKSAADILRQLSQMHYTLPTNSSRSKEVERYLTSSYLHLPFVIGQSTNKSHNLWVNIQEALSLIKHKVPQIVDEQSIVGHDVDNEKTASVISKLTTKSAKKLHQCPAHENDSLYDIPEYGEDTSKTWEDHPDCIRANIDPNNVRPRCSCLTQPLLSYKKVLRQIFGSNTAGSSDFFGNVNRAREDILQYQGGDTYITELRKVLVSVTQEFEELNNKYEEMLQDPNASKEELQQLENILKNKEDDIREIIARFKEMKEIGEKTQIADKSFCALETYKSTTSVRMVQTLRKVQQLKESLKSMPSLPFLTKSVNT